MQHAWKTLQVNTNLFGKPEEKKPLERIILKYILMIYIYIYIYIYKTILKYI
jgi:hypothetical protein